MVPTQPFVIESPCDADMGAAVMVGSRKEAGLGPPHSAAVSPSRFWPFQPHCLPAAPTGFAQLRCVLPAYTNGPRKAHSGPPVCSLSGSNVCLPLCSVQHVFTTVPTTFWATGKHQHLQ